AAALVKRINTEAATTPFEIDSISGSMNKLLPLFKGNSDAAVKAFRMIGDTAGGNAQKLETLTDAYTKVQMKGKTSMEELNRISNAGVPIFDVLSKKLGVTTEKLFEMSSAGEITAADLTGAFQQMTSEGGIFFNGMENSSDTFNMRLLGIKENVNILAGEIGAKFLPELKETAGAVADAVAEFSDWVGEGDNLERLLEGVGYALAGVTSGLAAFLAVSKGAAVINTLSAAFKGLTAAMKANPIGAVAVAVTAVAVPAFIALVKYLDESSNKVRTLNNELAKEKDIHSEAVTALEGLGDAKTIDADTTDKLIRLYPELTGKIEAYKTSVDDAKRVVEELNKQKSKDTIDGMVAAYKKETEALEKRNKEIEATKYVAENSMGVQKEAAQRTLATQEAALAEMKKHAEQSKAAIVSAYRGIGEEVVLINFGEFITKPLKALPKEGVKTGKETGGNIADGIEKTLSEKLKGIKLTPEQNFSENEAAFASYLNSIAGMEKLSGEERVAAIEAQEQRIRKSLKLTEDEKRALSDASADLQKQALDKEAKEAAAAREAEKALRQKEFEDMVSERDQLIDLYTRRHEAEKAVGEQSYEQRLEDLALYHMLETAALEEQIAAIREMTDIDNEWKVAEEERINLEMLESDKRYASAKIEIEKEAATAERALFQQRLGAAGNLAGSMSQLIKATGKENAAAAQAAKVVDMAQAAINTAMAISNALADPVPRPIAIANAVAMGIAGLAQEIAIARTPIPSAETGGRFVVPETASGVDGGLLRVNHGEVADITPRGGVSESESGGRTMIYLDGEVFVDFVNKKLRSGDIYEISPAWNMAVA
ncbi:MAG: tape measure protein, partial [Spirochaetaceae bacterium]|nr:tape measure protein [Spirochaetaceae bacterium]